MRAMQISMSLGIRKELRLMDSYDMDIPRVQRTLSHRRTVGERYT